MNSTGVSLTLVSAIVFASACVPTAARKNARVQPGADVDFTGGVQYVLEGEDEDGNVTDAEEGLLYAEVDLQWGAALENEDALAVQLKLPLSLVYTAIDLFYQLPSADKRLYFGFGAELSIAPAVYFAVTQYVNENLYVTLTPRLHTPLFDKVAVNPQVAVGFDSPAVDFSLFVAYQHIFGAGIDFKIASDSETQDFRNDFALLGGSIRF